MSFLGSRAREFAALFGGAPWAAWARDLKHCWSGVEPAAFERRRSAPPASSARVGVALEGCAGLTAAKIVGETADISRFGSRGGYAMNNGTAPIPVWSGNRTRFRLNRGGNRQLNAALHRIAITQIRLAGRGRAYLAQRMLTVRALRRRISDEVYRRLWQDHLAISTQAAVVAA